ncbi:Sulfate transporter [Richelia intracellularis]|nr:Sulfate transporter [Richelia intracellularis]
MSPKFRNKPLPLLPGLKILLSDQKRWLRGDMLAVITVAAYLIPQCMAYGELAGVQPVMGLWAILPPMIIYTLFGSSPQLSVGPESTTAVMAAVSISSVVGSNDANYASVASLLALMVGSVCIIGYIARLGFLADLLSKPILIGYMAGVAVIMIAGQLGKISGTKIDGNTLFGQLVGEFAGTYANSPTNTDFSCTSPSIFICNSAAFSQCTCSSFGSIVSKISSSLIQLRWARCGCCRGNSCWFTPFCIASNLIAKCFSTYSFCYWDCPCRLF